MDLYKEIYRRKSTRRYIMTPLPDERINRIKEFIKNQVPLLADIQTDYRIVGTGEIISAIPVAAPHYLVIYSQNKTGYLTNAAFLYEQLVLYLSALELGSCWLGMAKPIRKAQTDLEMVMVLAFGKPLRQPYRDRSGFKRKSLCEISSGEDLRLESARLAPSASNGQPWYFVCENGKILVCCKKHAFMKSMIYKNLNRFDIGLALCHLWIAGKQTGKDFRFTFQEERSSALPKGYYPIGVVE